MAPEILEFRTTINAPRKKVWHTMLDDETYREWTQVFNATSRFEGEWKEGATMRFIGTNEDGTVEGLESYITEVREHEFVGIEHRGFYRDGAVDEEEAKKDGWYGAHEEYTFTEVDGGTEVLVELDAAFAEDAFMKEAWPKALENLKEIAERP